MRSLLAVAAVVTVQVADGALASTAETQARLAAARPVATQAVSPPPAPVTGEQPPPGPGATTPAAPRPNLPAPPAPAPKPAPRRDAGLLLLIPALLSVVALARWLARRRRSAVKRV